VGKKVDEKYRTERDKIFSSLFFFPLYCNFFSNSPYIAQLFPLSFCLPSPVIYFEDVKGNSKKEKREKRESSFEEREKKSEK